MSTATVPSLYAFFRLMADLGAQPLVSSAAAVNLLPLSGRITDWYLKAEGYDPVDPSVDFIQYRHVTPDYFETLGIPLPRGRAFTRHDDPSAQPVAIVSQSLARRFWGDRNPIGRRVRPGGPDSPDPWHVVVGVVGEVHHSGARQGEVPIWYRSAYQYVWSSMSLVVRSGGDPALVASVIRDAVARVDPHQPVYRTMPMTELEGDSLSRERLCASLLTAFAALALGLSAMGVYSVLAYSVGQRTREIGVRLALGAHSGRVQREVVGEGLRLVLTGIGIGTGAALVLTRSLRSLLFGVTASDPVTFVGVAVVLTGAGLLACLLPARRAARVDVLVALRYE